MRMNRTMRSSSSTTRMRRRSRGSAMSLPDEADDLLFFGAVEHFDQRNARKRPNHLGDVVLEIMQVLAVALTRIHHCDDVISRLGEFFQFAGDGKLAGHVQNNGIGHSRLAFS